MGIHFLLNEVIERNSGSQGKEEHVPLLVYLYQGKSSQLHKIKIIKEIHMQNNQYFYKSKAIKYK